MDEQAGQGDYKEMNRLYAYSAEACHPFHVKAATQTGAKLQRPARPTRRRIAIRAMPCALSMIVLMEPPITNTLVRPMIQLLTSGNRSGHTARRFQRGIHAQ